MITDLSLGFFMKSFHPIEVLKFRFKTSHFFIGLDVVEIAVLLFFVNRVFRGLKMV